jgi:hypothetical protein
MCARQDCSNLAFAIHVRALFSAQEFIIVCLNIGCHFTKACVIAAKVTVAEIPGVVIFDGQRIWHRSTEVNAYFHRAEMFFHNVFRIKGRITAHLHEIKVSITANK